MKRYFKGISLITALIILFTMPVFSVASIQGDVDGDGKVTASDARKTLRASVGLDILDSQQKALADMDKNGSVTETDAIKILRLSVGLVDNAVISGMYAQDSGENYSSLETVYASSGYYAVPVILTSDTDVKDFTIVSVTLNENMMFRTKDIKNCKTLSAEEKICVYVTFSDMYPDYGFRYTDADGKEKIYGFVQSGMDGSLILQRIYENADVTAKYGSKYSYYSPLNTVYQSISNFSGPIVVTTDRTVTDFKVLDFNFNFETERYEINVIKNCGTLEKGKSVNIITTFTDLYLECGYSYVDADGTEKIYSLFSSGYDGSLVVEREFDTVKTGYPDIYLNATFGDNVYYDYSGFKTVYVNKTQYKYPVIFSANAPIDNLKVYEIMWTGDSKKYELIKTHNCGSLQPGVPMTVYIYTPEWTPTNAVGYIDSDGKERIFTIEQPVNGAGDRVHYGLGNEITLIR